MIRTFKDKNTESVFSREFVKRFNGIEQSAYTRLVRLDAAAELTDLAAIPGNRLEALAGDRKANTAFGSMTNGGSASAGSREKERTMSKSSTTTSRKKLPPVHPGQILAEDLRDAALSMNQLARAIHVPMNRISAIVNGQRGITGDTAVRLARYWGTTAEYWMNLQTRYELECAHDALADSITQIKPRTAA